jgi:hypothetical protein
MSPAAGRGPALLRCWQAATEPGIMQLIVRNKLNMVFLTAVQGGLFAHHGTAVYDNSQLVAEFEQAPGVASKP